jgi:F0F1-type ATP synthase assembly protein I
MNSQQEKTNLLPNRPSFFGLPTSWYLWSRVGARFWGGVLAGLGLGLFVARILAELEIPTMVWLRGIAIVLLVIGPIIALASVRRSLQSEKDQPQNQ